MAVSSHHVLECAELLMDAGFLLSCADLRYFPGLEIEVVILVDHGTQLDDFIVGLLCGLLGTHGARSS